MGRRIRLRERKSRAIVPGAQSIVLSGSDMRQFYSVLGQRVLQDFTKVIGRGGKVEQPSVSEPDQSHPMKPTYHSSSEPPGTPAC